VCLLCPRLGVPVECYSLVDSTERFSAQILVSHPKSEVCVDYRCGVVAEVLHKVILLVDIRCLFLRFTSNCLLTQRLTVVLFPDKSQFTARLPSKWQFRRCSGFGDRIVGYISESMGGGGGFGVRSSELGSVERRAICYYRWTASHLLTFGLFWKQTFD
jgi:hypothetical protein